MDTCLQQQFWKCQEVSMLYRVECALDLKFNSHLYRSGDVSLFVQLWSCWVLVGVGTLALIRSCTSVTTDGVNTQHAQICYD